MKIITVNDYHEMSKRAADIVIATIRKSADVTLGLATGGTPMGMYQEIVKANKKSELPFHHVHTVNLDEYVGLSANDSTSYHYYMNEHLFHHISIKKQNIHLPNGLATNLQQECQRYEQLIQKLGGIDLQILGIGNNGHIGFNEPGTSFQSTTHVVKLTESTRKANRRFFANKSDVPTDAITMGINTIFSSKEILLLASGSDKSPAINRLLTGPVDPSFPASVLQRHPNLTIIADEKALEDINQTEKGVGIRQ